VDVLPRFASRRHCPPRALIVDGDADNADSLALLLRASGFEVAVDYSGAAAIRRLEAWTPDAIISELVLPEVGGLDLAGHARRRHPHCVLIAVSSYGRPEDQARAAAAGFQHHFLKPLDIDRFVRFLHDVLRLVVDSKSN
jgi:CheY-like chemotaxis protein